MVIVTGIDVGLSNLGLVSVVTDENYYFDDIIESKRIDLTNLPHRKISFKECKLHHSNDATDRIQHFIQEYNTVLKQSNHIIIERQPIGGLVHVEQLLYSAFREIAILCNPNAIHKYFELPKGDRDLRKIKSVEIAKSYCPDIFRDYDADQRLHDISDALLMVMWFIENKQKTISLSKEIQTMTGKVDNINNFFDQFKFVGNQQIPPR